MSEEGFFDDLEQAIPHLRRYGRALAGDPDHADDLVQDTLVRAIAHRDRFREGTNLRAWAFALMHNIHIDQRRKRQRQGSHAPYEEELEAAGDDHEPTPQFRAMALDDVLEHCRALRRDEREVLLLVALKGLHYEEVADELGLALGTVKSRLFRARKRLREAGCTP